MPRGNINNLLKKEDRTPEQRRASAIKAGKASGVARAEKKTFRAMLEVLLEKELETKDGEKKTTREAILIGQIREAMKGKTKAAEFIRDTMGENPKQVVDVISGGNPINLDIVVKGVENGNTVAEKSIVSVDGKEPI